MKRLLSLLLSVAMILTMFSVLGVAASAEEEPDTDIGTEVLPEEGDAAEGEGDIPVDGDTTEGEEPEVTEPEEELPEEIIDAAITFVPTDEEGFSTYLYSNGDWEWTYDSEESVYRFEFDYRLLEPLYRIGSKLVITDTAGNERVYVCDENAAYVGEDGEGLDSELLSSCIEDNGEEVLFKVTYGDLSYTCPITILESDVESIEPLLQEPIALDAFEEGYYTRLTSGELSGQVVFHYNTINNAEFGFKVKLMGEDEPRIVKVGNDGKLYLDNNEEVRYSYDITERSSQAYMEWSDDASYTVDYFFRGASFTVEYAVTKNNVVDVNYIPGGEYGNLTYAADGEFVECDCDECALRGGRYFEYDQTRVFPADGDMITVTYQGGTSVVYMWESGWLYKVGDEKIPANSYHSIVCLYDTQKENHWAIGENSFTVRFLGFEDDVEVKVVDREIVAIEADTTELVQLYENTHGRWVTQDGEEIYIYRYSEYEELLYFTVYYSAGEPDYFYYDADEDYFYNEHGERFPYSFYSDDNQLENPWGIGTQNVTIYVGGFETVVSGEIIENPVESIDAIVAQTPVFKLEDPSQGYWYSVGEGDAYEEWFIYDFNLLASCLVGSRLIVNYKDGTVKEYSYDEEFGFFVDADGHLLPEIYSLSYRESQKTNKWTPDGDNYFIVEYMGARDKVSVVIDNGEMPVAAVIESVANVEGGIALTWAKVNDATEYLVYRRLERADGKVSNNPWVLVGTTTELSFVDNSDLTAGAYYKYHVHTVNTNGKSAYNGAATMTNRYIPMVEGFTATNTKAGVVFNWTKISGLKIRFFRQEEGSTEWVYLGEKDSDASYVCNVNAVNGKKYTYAAAYCAGSYAGEFAYADVTRLAEPQLKTIKNAVSGIYFNWSKVDGAVGYRVYRRAAGEKYFTYLCTTTNLWYCDQAVVYNNGTYYKYTVKAVAADGSMSSYEAGLLIRRLAIPYIQSLTNNTNGITVQWAEIPGATSYRIYRRGAGQTTWTYLASVTGLTYTDTAVKNNSGSYYRYTVKAVVNGIFTSYDPDGPYTMRLSTPTLKSAAETENGIEVKWNAVKGAQGYQVYRKTADSTWVLIDTVSGASYVDETALPGVEYTYTVRAYKGSYRSSYIPAGVSAHIEVAE